MYVQMENNYPKPSKHPFLTKSKKLYANIFVNHLIVSDSSLAGCATHNWRLHGLYSNNI
jgi:hypothetical protein